MEAEALENANYDEPQSDDQLVTQYQQQLAQYQPKQRVEAVTAGININTTSEPTLTSQATATVWSTVQSQLDDLSSDDLTTLVSPTMQATNIGTC